MFDTSYFEILSENPIELKSKCTGHSWKLIPLEGTGAFTLYHRHRDTDKYHWQTVCATLDDAIIMIQEHDEYQLNGRRCKNTLYCRDGVVRRGRFQRY